MQKSNLISNPESIDDEDTLIELRRQRRKEILAKYQNHPIHKPSILPESSQLKAPEPPSVPILPDSNSTRVEFEDDMFAPEESSAVIAEQASILDSKPVERISDHPALLDNWDDEEGYYRIILGEVLNSRYHVFANLGRGVFSSVVRASDTTADSADVAIKIIRHNELMYRAGLKELEFLQKLKLTDPDDSMHVVRYIDHFEHKNHLCIVFENLRYFFL